MGTISKKKKIHNIVASLVIADAMRTLRGEFMVSVRGYMCPEKKDTDLLVRAEHAARQAMEDVLLEEDGPTFAARAMTLRTEALNAINEYAGPKAVSLRTKEKAIDNDDAWLIIGNTDGMPALRDKRNQRIMEKTGDLSLMKDDEPLTKTFDFLDILVLADKLKKS